MVSATLQRHDVTIEHNTTIIGVSGGSDSLGLLHILAHLVRANNLIAVYIDHGLRPGESEQEKKVIKAQCQYLDICFEHANVNVAKFCTDNKCSLEEGARILRYGALERIRQKHNANFIGVGHTSNDQVEEFFLRLIRGTGLKGLSGMQFRNGAVIRPLLYLKKADIENYLSEKKIKWCIDSTNEDQSILRNRVRHDLLPHIQTKYNPSVDSSILRTMDILQQDELLLSQLTKNSYDRCVTDITTNTVENPTDASLKISLEVDNFLLEHKSIQRRILERCINHLGIPSSYEHITLLTSLAKGGETGKELHLPAGVRAVKEAKTILFFSPLSGAPVRGSHNISGLYKIIISSPGSYKIDRLDKHILLSLTDDLTLPQVDIEELKIDAARVTFPLVVRPALPGERFHPFNSSGSKKISRFYNDRKVPKRLRPTWPIILCEEKVIGIAGLEIDHSVRITASTTQALVFNLGES